MDFQYHSINFRFVAGQLKSSKRVFSISLKIKVYEFRNKETLLGMIFQQYVCEIECFKVLSTNGVQCITATKKLNL